MGSEYRRRFANMTLAAGIVDGFKGGKPLSDLVVPLDGMEDVSGVAEHVCKKLADLTSEDRDAFVHQLAEAHGALHVFVADKFAPADTVLDADAASEAALASWKALTLEQVSLYVLDEQTTDEMYEQYMDLLKVNRPDLFKAATHMLAEAKKAADKKAAEEQAALDKAAADKASTDKASTEKLPDEKVSNDKPVTEKKTTGKKGHKAKAAETVVPEAPKGDAPSTDVAQAEEVKS